VSVSERSSITRSFWQQLNLGSLDVREPTYSLERGGVVMEPDAADPREAWGVLNPGSARGRDGELYLFPRLVAEPNFSRIGRARVSSSGVERLGVVLEPTEAWERNPQTGGGVEDPRVTFVERLDTYVMTYTAFGPLGPRIGLAVSHDLQLWERLGPAWFVYEPELGTDVNLCPNKDAALFSEPVTGPDGRPSYALLHRPTWDIGTATLAPAGLVDERPGIWISFAPAEDVERDLGLLPRFSRHRPLALPEQPWEAAKIGAGTPPLRVPEGWLLVYHGVSPDLVYSAGVLILDADVTTVVARSPQPLLRPETRKEREGIVPNVVFPTAIDGDDVFYGMADTRIGSARLRRQ
jgi:beta-1,2-mannobiose phosphorylase / 1,2-beta-oligomannan phosphorylase